jgi:hypothetical protein
MESTINAPTQQAAAVLAAAAALPMTASGEQTLALVRDLARIARYLGELTAAARDHWAAWGTVTPHLQQAEALAADVTRCLTHAAGTYAFNTTGPIRPSCPRRVAHTRRPEHPADHRQPPDGCDIAAHPASHDRALALLPFHAGLPIAEAVRLDVGTRT